MGKAADQYLQVDPWKIIEEGFHPQHSRVSESLFSLGNEHMGIRGTFDETYTGSSLVGCYLNGVLEEYFIKEPSAYKSIPDRICFMVNTVNWLHTRIEMDGEELDLNHCRFDHFRRELDFKSGELRREFTWTSRTGKELRLVFKRFLSMSCNELGYQRIELTAINFSGPVSIQLGLDFSALHAAYNTNFWDCPKKSVQAGTAAILGESKNLHNAVFAGFNTDLRASGKLNELRGEKMAGCHAMLHLEQGRETVLDRQAILYTPRRSQPLEQTWEQGLALLQDAAPLTYPAALEQNAAYWDKFWERFDIVIEGDPLTQQGIRFCLFQLQQTYRGAVEGSNIGAKGLTGEAYNGNAFWDTETYCLAYYIFSNPGAARALLDFRYKTLPQAMERARQLDCQGACFPIATSDGTESCTLWQHACLQMQSTTAVGYGIWHYVKITQDTDFLYKEGIELLFQICRFLASRGQWSPRLKKFGYYAVMGPDEFQMMVNNSAYTNFMALQNFRYTLQVLADMEANCPALRAALLDTLQAGPAELAEWQHMADNMLIPYDPQTKLYEEHQGFFDLPHIDIDAIPVEDFPLYYHWAYDRIYRNDMIKQPDVLMFMFLYNQSFTLEEKRANYDYYEPRCIHESSLSPSVHSILAAELGRHREAYDFFSFATRIDLDNYNNNTADGIHMTSISAAWMNIVYGFGGMRSDGEMLVFKPSIPAHWESYRFQIAYRGSILAVNVTQQQAEFRVVEGENVSICIQKQVFEVTRDGLSVSVRDDVKEAL